MGSCEPAVRGALVDVHVLQVDVHAYHAPAGQERSVRSQDPTSEPRTLTRRRVWSRTVGSTANVAQLRLATRWQDLSHRAGDSGAPGIKAALPLSSCGLSRPKGQEGESRQAVAFLARVSRNLLTLAGDLVAFNLAWVCGLLRLNDFAPPPGTSASLSFQRPQVRTRAKSGGPPEEEASCVMETH